MKAWSCFLLLSVVLATLPGQGSGESDPNKIVAFPGAFGAGSFTVGGRGGEVYRVTNLNSSGPGSLADAVSQPNRIIVFTVSGVIDLSGGVAGKHGQIVLDKPHITIAGQTAPGEGICLKHGCLTIRTSDVIVRHLRVRRGYITEGDSGDSIMAKPIMKKATAAKTGVDPEKQKKIEEKKKERGKFLKEPADLMEHILLDHVSATWATDENLTMTHPNWTTAQFCLIAEGLDYANPKQTPPRHSEGSLWGVSAADGRSTFHHNLYAHNRLRNPRTTGGDSPLAVLEFRNNVVYNASENFSHTGHEAVHVNWLDNYYKAGPSTPERLKGSMFEFNHSRESRMFARGNVIDGDPQATRDNWRAIRYSKGLSAKDESVLRVDQPFPAPPMPAQSAADAYQQVLAEVGATLPARDPVDLRIVQDVRNGTGRIIEKETDLPPEQRWPTYHALPAPADRDGDGLPDFWEEQFGLDPNNPRDSRAIGHGGYANIEHYINNTDPRGGSTPIVSISAAVSRAYEGTTGVLKVARTGSTQESLLVRYAIGGNAAVDGDYERLTGTVTIPAGAASALISVKPIRRSEGEKLVIITLEAAPKSYHVGCPNAALVALGK